MSSPRARVVTGVVVFLVLAVVMLLVFLILELGRASNQIQGLNQGDQSRDRAITALAGEVDTARAQIKALGGTPNVPPPQVVISGAAGPQGLQGPGPSDAQVQAAVDVYLGQHPPSGTVPTAVVDAAVTVYLTAHPPAPGPPPSDAQVAAAVAAYMAANPAPSGPPGPQGQPGVGQTGPAGAPGKDGAPGSPPAGWTWTDPSGTTYNCVPDGQTPAPHYTCAAPSPSPSASSPSSSPPPSPTASAAANPFTSGAPADATQPEEASGGAPAGRQHSDRLALLLGVPFYRRAI
jgi:hypothetical protein